MENSDDVELSDLFIYFENLYKSSATHSVKHSLTVIYEPVVPAQEMNPSNILVCQFNKNPTTVKLNNFFQMLQCDFKIKNDDWRGFTLLCNTDTHSVV